MRVARGSRRSLSGMVATESAQCLIPLCWGNALPYSVETV